MIKHIVLSLMALTLAMTGMNAVATCPGDGEEVDGSGIGRASLSKKDREGKTGIDNYRYFLDTKGEFVGENDDEFEYGEGRNIFRLVAALCPGAAEFVPQYIYKSHAV